MTAKEIVVTGANGFIGRQVALGLHQAGYSVTGLVRSAWKNCDFKLVTGFELGSDGDWSTVFRHTNTIVHCAARVHVMDDNAIDPLTEFRRVNVDGTLKMARQAAQCGVERFIFVSTVKVNGERTLPGRKFSEMDVPAPADAYAMSKLEAEEGLRDISGATGMEVVFIRPPLVYGAGVKGNFLSMLRLADTGCPLPFGAINNYRSMIYLDNLVSLIVCTIDHPDAGNRTFLVSDGEDLSTTDLFAEVRRSLGRKRRLLPIPSRTLSWLGRLTGKRGVTDRLCDSLQVDITGARQVLGWEPPFSVRAGLENTAAEYKRSARWRVN